MKRKKYSYEFKQQVIKEAIETGNNSIVARRYELSSSMVSRWVREYENDNFNFKSKNNSLEINPNEISKENQQLSQENTQLKKILGEKDLEIEILKDLIKKQNPHLLTKLK